MSRLTRNPVSSGTPAYMSPQQMNSQAPRVTDDVYALGATLYELLTSKPPFYGGDVYRQVQDKPATPLDQRLADLELSNEIPADVAALIMACLSKEPEQRPQSAGAVAEWIGVTLGTRPTGQLLASATAVAPELVGETQNAELGEAEEQEPVADDAEIPARGRWNAKASWWIAGGTLVGVLTGLLFWWSWKNRDSAGFKQLGKAYTNAVGAEMIYVPPGEFMMGSTAVEKAWVAAQEHSGPVTNEGESPRKARINTGFWLGRTEVTVGQWKQFVAATNFRTDAEKGGKAWGPNGRGKPNEYLAGACWKDTHFDGPQLDSHAVSYLSWNDAMAFCEWLTQREREAGRLPAGFAVRLPTEAEWEYACRGGTQTKFWWGDAENDGKGRLNWSSSDDGYPFVAPVDNYGAAGRNGFGLADMLGNVGELCLDGWDESGAHEDYYDKGGYRRVMRGFGFGYRAASYRCACRRAENQNRADYQQGFRVCLGPDVHGSAAAGSSNAVAPSAPAASDVVNLLALVSVPRDAVYGNWTVAADGLAVQRAGGGTALEFQYDVPEEYDYEIEFTPQGDGLNVNQYLSAGGHAFAWKLNSHGVSPPLYGFELLDGKYARQRMTEAAVQKPMRIESGKRYTSKVEVRRGSLRALVNGEEYVKWSGDFSRLSMEPQTKMKNDRHLGVGSWQRGVVFHRAEIRNAGPTPARGPGCSAFCVVQQNTGSIGAKFRS